MCLWLFIAESTFYRYYIECCHLTWFHCKPCMCMFGNVYSYLALFSFFFICNAFHSSQQWIVKYKGTCYS